MAIDTAGKRASCIIVGLAIARVWPIPDGSLASDIDRPHIAYCYSMAASDVSEPEAPCALQIAAYSPAALGIAAKNPAALGIAAYNPGPLDLDAGLCEL